MSKYVSVLVVAAWGCMAISYVLHGYHNDYDKFWVIVGTLTTVAATGLGLSE